MNRRLVSLLIAASAWAVAMPSFAQRNEIPARVALRDQGGAVEVILTGRRDNTIYARLRDAATGNITYEAADIKRIAVRMPDDELSRAEALAAVDRGEEALAVARNAVRPVVPYLDLPIDGAVEPAMRYAALARGEKAWAEAITILRAMQKHPDPAVSQRAVGWLAYVHMKNQQVKEAREWGDRFPQDDPRHDGFTPAMLALCMINAADGRDDAALDYAARAAALTRIDHELYPEAMFLAADAYFRLSQKPQDASSRQEVVLGKTPADAVPALPMLPGEFLTVASNQFTQVVSLFPASPFAAAAQERLVVIGALSLTNQIPSSTTGVTP